MRLTPEEEQQLLAAFRGEQPPETPTPEPHVWVEAPVINGQAKTPTGSSQAEIERSQNLSRLFGGDKDGIR